VVTPGTFTVQVEAEVFDLGSCMLFMCTGGHLPERVVKVICTDLSGLVSIRQVRSQV
jgi:hypothetical protein